MNLEKIGKVFRSKLVGTGPSSYKKNNLPGRGLTKFDKHCYMTYTLDKTSANNRSSGVFCQSTRLQSGWRNRNHKQQILYLFKHFVDKFCIQKKYRNLRERATCHAEWLCGMHWRWYGGKQQWVILKYCSIRVIKPTWCTIYPRFISSINLYTFRAYL